MRTRVALSSIFQPCASFFCNTAAARSQVLASCASLGRGAWRALLSASKMRFLISAAALRVKVSAALSSGRATRASSTRKRWMRSSVLPEPAGAWTMNEPVGSSARARCARSGMAFTLLLGIDALFGNKRQPKGERRLFRDPAKQRLVAVSARLRGVLRIHPRGPLGKAAPERIELALPALL